MRKKVKLIKLKKDTKAQKLLITSNTEIPNKAGYFKLFRFYHKETWWFWNGEKYYLEGLAIEPNHNGINEYLGELYVATGRMELAKERLNILKNCNCEEFKELKEVIEGKKKSKY